MQRFPLENAERPKPSCAPPKPSSKCEKRMGYEADGWEADQLGSCKSEDANGAEDAELNTGRYQFQACKLEDTWPQSDQFEACKAEDTWPQAGYSQEGFRIIRESHFEAKLMLTMPGFTRSHISRMIGKRGCNLLELSKRSHAKVHLCGKDSNRPTNEANHLLIRGSEVSVEKALAMACQKVVEVLGTDIPECAHCGGDHKSRDCLTIRLPCVERVFLDATANVGFIIGSGGRNVQPIKEATGALIRMCGIGSGELHASEPLHMRIECKTEEALAQAVRMAHDLIDRVTSWTPYDDPPPPGYDFQFRQKIELEFGSSARGRQDFDSLNAHLLGKRGQNFKRIHESTGAYLWLRGQGSGISQDGAGDAPMHLLIEHDDLPLLQEAVRMAQELLDSVEARLQDTFCRVCGGAHFTYRCTKANSAGYLKEMKGKGGGAGKGESRNSGGYECGYGDLDSEERLQHHEQGGWYANKHARWG
ncbi:unnamed protein product [Durusdinium trenchii]|uniref:K Homology domain-containing protein n=1 Tax=Durusdinium trenchii TaxID=1381693 RepID=A0ABP0KFR1_9DINO